MTFHHPPPHGAEVVVGPGHLLRSDNIRLSDPWHGDERGRERRAYDAVATRVDWVIILAIVVGVVLVLTGVGLRGRL